MKPYEYDRHHICPSSRGGTGATQNIIDTRRNIHVAFHTLFRNMLPHEQLLYVLQMDNTALKKEFSQELYDILSRPDLGYYYKNGVLIKKYASETFASPHE